METHSGDNQNGSSLQVTKSIAILSSPRKLSQKGLFIAQVLVRIFAIVFIVAAISVMITSDQTVTVYGIRVTARYSYSSATKFLLGVDIVVCILSTLSLIFVWVSCRSTSNRPKYYFFLFVHDMVMMVLMISGCAAATAVGYVGRYGEEKIGWAAVCQNVSKFCNQVLASFVLSYLVFFSYFILTNVSAQYFMMSTRSVN